MSIVNFEREKVELPPPLKGYKPPKIDKKAIEKMEQENKLYYPIEVNINYRKGEFCYFASFAEFFKNVTVTDRINYRGPVLRIKIIPGLSYRLGSAKVNTMSHVEFKKIDYGNLYITNQRIFFNGNGDNKTINYDDILDINGYKDGVSIENESGALFVFKLNKKQAKEACMMMLNFLKITRDRSRS